MEDYRRFHAGLGLLYLLGGLILVEQASELILTLTPIHAEAAPWRFGAVGLTLGRTTAFLFADTLIGVAAFTRGDWRFVKVWGWLHLLLGVAVLAVLAGFALDVLTVRRAATGAQRRNVELTSLRAVLVGGAVAILALRAGLIMSRFGKRKTTEAGPQMVFDPAAAAGRGN